jgi:hypothetical protein
LNGLHFKGSGLSAQNGRQMMKSLANFQVGLEITGSLVLLIILLLGCLLIAGIPEEPANGEKP